MTTRDAKLTLFPGLFRCGPSRTLFPYTTLFRSLGAPERPLDAVRQHEHPGDDEDDEGEAERSEDTRLNSSHTVISYAVFCLKKKTKNKNYTHNGKEEK